jgi:phage terminase small subunit
VKKESGKKNEKPLSLRERRFIKALIAGDCPTEAMRKAGYAESTALRKAGEKLQIVQPAISDICEREGLTDEEACPNSSCLS